MTKTAVFPALTQGERRSRFCGRVELSEDRRVVAEMLFQRIDPIIGAVPTAGRYLSARTSLA